MKKLNLYNILLRAAFLYENIKKEHEPEDEERKKFIEETNQFIDLEIASAIQISLDDLATLYPQEDGNSYVINIEQDINAFPYNLCFNGKKTTITIRGIKHAIDHSELCKITFPEGGFIIGKKTVLILKDIVVKSKYFSLTKTIEINGGILVLINSKIEHGDHPMSTLTSDYKYTGWVFHEGLDIGIDAVSAKSNDPGLIYIYEKISDGQE